MSNELQKIETNNVINWDCATQIKAIKDIYGKKLSNEEFGVFVNLGKATGLNPFLRELWAVKYREDKPASIFIARDGYRKSAQQSPNYDYHLADAVYSNDGFKVINGEVFHEYNIKNRGNLVGSYCIVKRKSASRPTYVFVDFAEYDTKQSLWLTKKATMIKKVAEAQCLRMAFQELFAGTYSEDEFQPDEKVLVSPSENISHLIKNKAPNDQIINISTRENVFSSNELSEVIEQDIIDAETGEIVGGNSCGPTFQDVKKQMEDAKTVEDLILSADTARTLSKSLPKEQHDQLLGLYKQKQTALAVGASKQA